MVTQTHVRVRGHINVPEVSVLLHSEVYVLLLRLAVNPAHETPTHLGQGRVILVPGLEVDRTPHARLFSPQ